METTAERRAHLSRMSAVHSAINAQSNYFYQLADCKHDGTPLLATTNTGKLTSNGTGVHLIMASVIMHHRVDIKSNELALHRALQTVRNSCSIVITYSYSAQADSTPIDLQLVPSRNTLSSMN